MKNSSKLLENAISLQDIRDCQSKDQVCLDISKFLDGEKVNELPKNFTKNFCKIDGLICYITKNEGEILYRYFLPSLDLQQRALYNAHSSHFNNHVGYTRCLKNLTNVVYWQNLPGDLYDYVAKCEECLLYKKINNIKKASGPLTPSTALNQIVFIDLVGPLTHSKKYTFILSMFDSFSQFLYLYPLRNATAEEVIKHIFDYHIYIFDPPLIFCLDNGSAFISLKFTKLAEIYSIGLRFICPRSPWENSIEKVHKDIKNHLRTLINGSETAQWHSYLPAICRIHSTNWVTPLKTSPYKIHFGRIPRNSIIQDISFPTENFPPLLATHLYNVQNLYKFAAENKGLYTEKLIAKKKKLKGQINIGDKIYIRKPYIQGKSSALQAVLHGPHTITKKIGNFILEYSDNNNITRRCHVNNCKALHMDSES